MTDVVIVGKIYNAGLEVGGGPIIPGGQPGVPTHPIYNPAYPSHPIAPGGQPGYPSHPIYNPAYPDQGLPQPPLGIWGGVAPPYPDQGLPGGQPYPGHGLPPFPSHPIAPGGGQPPLGMWGPTDPRPSQPIYIPGQPIIPDPGDPEKAHIVVYVPGAGAVKFTVDLTQLPEPVPPTEATPKAE